MMLIKDLIGKWLIDESSDVLRDFTKNKLLGFIKKTRTKKLLKNYLDKEEKRNYSSSLSEEIDFGGIKDYILEIDDEFELYFFGNLNEREEAKKRIVNNSLKFASAGTRKSEVRIEGIIENSINILAAYYRKNTNKDLRFLTNEMKEDCISELRQKFNEFADEMNAKDDAKTAVETHNVEKPTEKQRRTLESTYSADLSSPNRKRLGRTDGVSQTQKRHRKYQKIHNSCEEPRKRNSTGGGKRRHRKTRCSQTLCSEHKRTPRKKS